VLVLLARLFFIYIIFFFFFKIINFLHCYAYFQLEDVSRHPWVTQYVNGEYTPINRRDNCISMSSVRSNDVLNRKSVNINHHDHNTSLSFMFVFCLLIRRKSACFLASNFDVTNGDYYCYFFLFA
jgi:hypothetical protein